MNLSLVGTKQSLPRRYGFVVPRYERGLAGGAETLAAQLAEHLAARGDQVEIITTCARDNRTWQNELPAGQEQIGRLTIRRFSVDDRDLERWVPYQLRLHDGMQLALDEQLEWMQHSVNSAGLYDYIAAQSDNFDLLFFAPYLFGTTFWGSLIAPERSVLIPCLHDESYAYTEVLASMFRQVRGALFNAAAEGELARRLYGDIAGGEVGMGFNPHTPEYVSGLEPLLDRGHPYVLYVGRKETGKNVQKLIDDFIAAKELRILPDQVDLVIAGGGSYSDLGRPEALERDDVIDIGYLSEDDKARLIRHSTVLCQPSTNESFSIVLMEAWLLGTTVLVSSDCPVTREHVVASGGGLYYRGAAEFGATVRALVEDARLRQQLAEAGDAYVRLRYSWPAVLARFDFVVEKLLQEREA